MCINFLFYIAKVNKLVFSFFYSCSGVVKKLDLEFQKTLVYPSEKKIEDLDGWLDNIESFVVENNPYNILSASDLTTHEFKIWLYSLNYRQLFNVHKYFNVKQDFHNARLVFHMILRKQLRFRSVLLSIYGFRRYITSLMLVSQMKNTNYVNSSQDKFLFEFLFLLINCSKNKYLSSLIDDKTISLVGGGSERGAGKLIDSNELVVRLNTMDVNPQLIYDIGSRFDVVIMRSVRCKYLHKLEGRNALINHSNVFFVFKNRAVFNLFDFGKKSIAVNIESCFPYGGLNGLQAALFELSYYNANVISIFGADFQLSKGHMVGYLPENLNVHNIDLTFGEHPSHVQFLITKYFIKKGSVKHNGSGSKIINLSYRAFCRQFDNKFSIKL